MVTLQYAIKYHLKSCSSKNLKRTCACVPQENSRSLVKVAGYSSVSQFIRFNSFMWPRRLYCLVSSYKKKKTVLLF